MAKIFTKTYGCSLNHSDSEVMKGVLAEKGHILVDDEQDADIILVNSCTVKGQTEKNLFRYLEDRKDKKIVIAGCVPQSQPKRLAAYPLVGTTQLGKVAEVIESALNGQILHQIQREKQPRLNLPKRRVNPAIEIVPINDGCLGVCTFCATKFARGTLRSYTPKDIVRQVTTALQDGLKEVWFTSPDTACYGFDMDTNLPALIQEVCAIPGDFRVRIGMGNPDHFITYIEEIGDMFLHENVFKFLHIPVQSGNDTILSEMKRNYDVATFKKIVTAVREKVPNITIASDIIVGFPGETDEQFQDTVTLIKEIRPNCLNISRFAPRPGTPAARRTDQVHGRISKERSRIITELFTSISEEENKKWIGKTCRVLIDQEGKNNTLVGRNDFYKQVIVTDGTMGEWKDVTITDATVWDLRA